MKPNKSPRLSVNKVGEYLISGPARRRRIIYDAKFPSDIIVPFYTPAEEAISQYIASGMQDISVLEKKINTLGQSPIETVWDQRRVNSNIDAIEAFMNMLDDIDLNGASPQLGTHKAPVVTFNGVDVSVRPEIVLTKSGNKGKALVGGLKLHFPRANPLNEQSAAYVSSIQSRYVTDHLPEHGLPEGRMCAVIDVSSQSFFPGVASTRQRLKDVGAACAEIAAIWPTITK